MSGMRAMGRGFGGGALRLATSPRRALLPLAFFLLCLAIVPAFAVRPIAVGPEQDRLEITPLGELRENTGDLLHVEMATGPDGVGGRYSVRVSTPGTNPNWFVFALYNPTTKTIEKWLTADRYTIIGSGIVWPDLDARRLEAVTPSRDFIPDRVRSDRADVFRLQIGPGQTITYAAELSSERFARLYLWNPTAYEQMIHDRQLFSGLMLGIVALLAVFLTTIFAANHKAIFPAASLVAWCVLALLSVEFGFFHKLFYLRPEDTAIHRAAAEAAMAASFVVFIWVFLRLWYWPGFARVIFGLWIAGQLALIVVALVDPRAAATFARLSFLLIAGLGSLLIAFLALRGQDRALAILPTWMLFLVWLFGASVALVGRLPGDLVVYGLISGLVLIVVLLGFTVTQFAFRASDPHHGTTPGQAQLRALAVDGAGAAVWEWNGRRNEIRVGPMVEEALGLKAGDLSATVDEFVKHLHPADRERMRLALVAVAEKKGGQIRCDLRMRRTDSTYRWFELEAASVPSADTRHVRCVGLIREATDQKRAMERLMHDAVRDSLTGLPNRTLLLDRLGQALQRLRAGKGPQPAILFIDIDSFRNINASFGLIVGDSLLLTLARRLQRFIGPEDTLARVGGDQFALLVETEQTDGQRAELIERLRRALKTPIKIAGREVMLTAAVGVALGDGALTDPAEVLREAELAMHRAKRAGADRIEVFKPSQRGGGDERAKIEADLARAIERRQLEVVFQPIIYLPTEDLAGFDALLRWNHPELGLLDPQEYVSRGAESDLVVRLAAFLLERAAAEAASWQKTLPRPEAPLFVGVTLNGRQLFRADLVQEIRHSLGRALVPKGGLRLNVAEAQVLDNPELASEMLDQLKAAGAGLTLDSFGAGYSSLTFVQRLPFETLRIDAALIQSASQDSAGNTLVRSIVALAHELGRKTVAAGVEMQEDVAFLRSIGCEFGQGPYYSDYMTGREALDLVRQVRKSDRRVLDRGWLVGGRKSRVRKGLNKANGKGKPEGEAPQRPSPQAPVPPAAAVDQPGPPAASHVAGAPANGHAPHGVPLNGHGGGPPLDQAPPQPMSPTIMPPPQPGSGLSLAGEGLLPPLPLVPTGLPPAPPSEAPPFDLPPAAEVAEPAPPFTPPSQNEILVQLAEAMPVVEDEAARLAAVEGLGVPAAGGQIAGNGAGEHGVEPQAGDDAVLIPIVEPEVAPPPLDAEAAPVLSAIPVQPLAPAETRDLLQGLTAALSEATAEPPQAVEASEAERPAAPDPAISDTPTVRPTRQRPRRERLGRKARNGEAADKARLPGAAPVNGDGALPPALAKSLANLAGALKLGSPAPQAPDGEAKGKAEPAE